MLLVPLHPSMCRSVIPVAALCRSVLLRPTLRFLEPLRVTRAALRLYTWLLPYLCCSAPLCDTKIYLDNTEELILNAKTHFLIFFMVQMFQLFSRYLLLKYLFRVEASMACLCMCIIWRCPTLKPFCHSSLILQPLCYPSTIHIYEWQYKRSK